MRPTRLERFLTWLDDNDDRFFAFCLGLYLTVIIFGG